MKKFMLLIVLKFLLLLFRFFLDTLPFITLMAERDANLSQKMYSPGLIVVRFLVVVRFLRLGVLIASASELWQV